MKKIFIIIAFVFAWATRAFAQIEVNNEDVKGPVKLVMIILESASPGAQISTYGGPVLNRVVIFTHYDTKGRIVRREHFHGEELADGYFCRYANNKCKEYNFDAKGIVEGHYRNITFDSAGHKISDICYMNGKFFAKDSIVYDSLERVVKTYENMNRKNDSLVLRYTYEYDSIGRIDSYKDWRNKNLYNVHYSPDGNYVMHCVNEKDGKSFERKYTVNKKGQLVKVEGSNMRMFLSNYDKHGNWLHLKGMTNTNTPMGWFTTITSRKIEYYSEDEIESPEAENDTIYLSSEQLPEFPGGQKAMFQYIAHNVVYPESARINGIQGRTICQFVVNKSGSLSDIKILKSSGNNELDEEAVNVIASMPKWIPGRSAGEIVRVKYTIPVTFKIAAQVPTNDSLVISTDTTIHAIVNQMPEFPGGQQALFDYLANNIRYPNKANGAQGRVIITFVVEQDGSISNVVIAKSSGNKWLDQEGIRLIKSMPKWKPGRLKGEIVRVKYSVPITFLTE